MSSPLKNFALPGVALLGIIAYWIWRSTATPVDAPAPAAPEKASPPAKTTPRGNDDAAKPSTTARDTSAKPSDAAKPPTPPTVTERDRAKTEGLRLALRERWDASGRRTGGGGGAAEAEEPLGTLDKDYIRSRIQDDLVPIAKECYESALEDEPKLGGKLVMKFAIVGDEEVGGVVEEADVDPTSDIKHPELLECMKESMLALSFAPPEGGGRVEVTYPFQFASDGPPDGKQ
jgi:hypothetical protein